MVALDHLKKIMQIEGVDRNYGKVAREDALSAWIKEWVVEVESEKSVIKTEFTSEEEDYLKYHLATCMAEKLMEDVIRVDNEKYKIKTSIVALRRGVNS